eukprot:1207100-Rhodomonas_salina.6
MGDLGPFAFNHLTAYCYVDRLGDCQLSQLAQARLTIAVQAHPLTSRGVVVHGTAQRLVICPGASTV